jgi:hypothetical protein
MVVMWSPIDLRPTQAIVGPTRESKLNSESALVPVQNSDRNFVCNQCASNLHIVAIRARRITRARHACKSVARIFRNTSENC